ncbi:SAM-dependent methyltransferase [Candidatus Berkiella cookevillensis]|uniref:SAM-dependent methyltransferase n=1 Tax=Candidatus Berkiella cookevillensis TaxID=437022 RepID=A0A0Q9YEH8_9GAMM|nr:SAM-dependent methyltransferase [Candidatus Berkiella cookevillensis]MCS5707327.1 SAM-dependent methyltransferase [Candidatus Berkiella cookevillensis]
MMHTQNISTPLATLIKAYILDKGPIPFSEFMHLALYHPELGYYCNSAINIGAQGDFSTAPHMSSLFSECIARQIIEIQSQLEKKPHYLLELGAGRGKMATDILSTLATHQALPEKYFILEISPALITKQKEYLSRQIPDLAHHIEWVQQLSDLPKAFQGTIISNEFLDALPIEIFQHSHNTQALQGFVDVKDRQQDGDFVLFFEKSTDPTFIHCVEREMSQLEEALPSNYISEINTNIDTWISELSTVLEKGVMLFIDYGFDRHTFYHPDRSEGTLMCHYKHQTHANYFSQVGEQDITAHVNFSQLHNAAQALGLNTLGYTNQASFLLALNILENISISQDEKQRAVQSHALQMLLQPHEMGELFKVIALGKKFEGALQGFSIRDYQHRL